MNKKTVDHDQTIAVGHDDYALERVPPSARYSWLSTSVQRFGQLADLSQFLLGATLGFGMTFWGSFWAITLGTVILEIVAIFTGIAGQREGMSTSLLSRWAGFGRIGSTLLGLVIAISLVGWFGIQNAIFAEGMHSLLGFLPIWAWTIITGLLITAIVVFGFKSMAWLAYITVPAFVLLAAYSIIVAFEHYSLGALIASPHPGPTLSIAAGTTIVAGGYIVGAVITPDITRYNRSKGDVIKQSVLSIVLGQYPIGLIGVLLAHAVKSSDVTAIVTSTSGILGTLILVFATLKINDWNLYSSSLGFVNTLDTLFHWRVNRGVVTIFVGVIGSILSAVGILERFTGFLTILGVTVPPIAGVIVIEYFLIRRYRNVLDESRAQGILPATAELWNPIAIVVWIISSIVGYYVQWGIPALNSLACSMILYFVGMKLYGLVRRPVMEVRQETSLD